METCDRPVATREWCQAHYNRLVKLGDVRAEIPLRPRYTGPKRTICSVKECEQPSDGNRALCVAHRARQLRLGDVQAEKPLRRADPFDKWCAYETAHWRTRRNRGSASVQACVECGNPAKHWAYSGKAEHEFTGTDFRGRNVLFWSGNPADYDPMCVPCHVKRDTLLAHFRWLAEVAPDLVDEVKRRTQIGVI